MLPPLMEPSADKVATLRESIEAFNRRDVEAWVEFTHPDVTLVPTQYWAPLGTIYTGRAGLRTYAHEMFRQLPYLYSEQPELRDLGDRVLGRGPVVSGSDEASASTRTIACLFELKDGHIYRIDAFRTWSQGLEAARVRSQNPFGMLFRHAAEALILTDEDACIEDANGSACDLFGLSADELRGRTLFEFTTPNRIGPLEALWRRVRAEGYASSDSEILAQTGVTHRVELRAKADFIPGRHLVRIRDADSFQSERSAGPRLTSREREVFHLLALGLNTSEVAVRLVLSPNTVRTHVQNGIGRMEARNRVQAIAIALKRGEITI
jgi:PAS domain S-box-containing protein